MNPLPTVQPDFQSRFRTMSTGMKLVVICALALLMTIPAFFVESLVEDRMQRKTEVLDEISSHAGGEQTLLGPTLMIPYSVPPGSARGMYVVFPAVATASIRTTTEERHRSMFKVLRSRHRSSCPTAAARAADSWSGTVYQSEPDHWSFPSLPDIHNMWACEESNPNV